MDRFPIEPRRRKFIELIIRAIDIIVYAVVFTGGVFALFYTPVTVQNELSGWTWLIPFWAVLLMVGGLLGFIGRLTTIWLLEPPATVAGATGILMYFVVLGRTSFETVTSTVATLLIFVALLFLVRRYLELQLFGSNPHNKDLRAKFDDALKRRIPNVTPRG